MSRIPPSCLRYTSGVKSSSFIGTSSYYFERQNKQNLALYAAAKPLNRILKWRAKRNRRTEPFVLQPGLFPVYTQLKAIRFVRHMLQKSHSWFKNKTLSCASHISLGLFEKKHCVQIQEALANRGPNTINALVSMHQKRSKNEQDKTSIFKHKNRVIQRQPYYCIHANFKQQKEKELRRGYWDSLQCLRSIIRKPQNKQQHKDIYVSKSSIYSKHKAPCIFMLLCLHMLKQKVYDTGSKTFVQALNLGSNNTKKLVPLLFFDETLSDVPNDYQISCTTAEHFPKALCKSKRQFKPSKGSPNNKKIDVAAYEICDIYNSRPKIALSRSFNKPLSPTLFLHVNGLLTYAKKKTMAKDWNKIKRKQGFQAYDSSVYSVNRLKTCLVFDLKLKCQNQDIKTLQPTLSIRL